MTMVFSTRWVRSFLGGCFIAGVAVIPAYAASPTPEKLLDYKPKQEVNLPTPSATEIASYKVDLEKGKLGGSGWVLKDASGNYVRRYFSSNGRDVDSYSYFKDGVEVYREIVTPGSRAPDQFRWMNAGGSKWGVDENKDGTIDTWKQISVEEVSQEVLRAMVTKDIRRFQALLITDADITLLGLPNETADAIRTRRKDVVTKFDKTIKDLSKLSDKSNWVHVETLVPESVTADTSGSKVDYLRHTRATVLFETAGQSDWFQLGQLIQVGAAWKLVDAPTPGATPANDERSGSGGPMAVDPATQKLLTALGDLDKASPGTTGEAAAKHHLDRADLLEKIIAAVKPNERDPWIRQVADSLSSAAQAAGSTTSSGLNRLTNLEKQLAGYMPGANLTGYVAFRKMQAEYSIALSKAKGDDFAKVQKDWLENLTAFVKAYPKADDTPDAMLQLGMVCEFLGKEVEAKNWYLQLGKSFEGRPQALKGEGAARRLGLEGQTMALAAPTLSDSGTPYDIDQLRGKIVVVYYWASWNGQANSDFARLKAIVEKGEGKVAVLGVNVDATAKEGKEFADKNSAPGVQLYTPGGLDSKLATQYGVMVLPSVFVVGADGKVANKAGQIGTLEDEIKKMLKK